MMTPAPGKARHSGLFEYHFGTMNIIQYRPAKETAMNNPVMHEAPSRASISSQQPKRRRT
jgi:hypothetical protein